MGWRGRNALYHDGALLPEELSHVKHPRCHVLGDLGHLAGAALPCVTVLSLLLHRAAGEEDAGRTILVLLRQ